jgi:O-acetylserine/cysteine efflux transporter
MRVDEVVPFVLLMTPVGLITAVVFLGETIAGVQLLGGAVLVFGLAIVIGLVKVPSLQKS